MPTKYQTMYETFTIMFPNFGERAVKYKQARNGAGILITLDDRTELQFSFLDNKTWWLKTT